MLRNYLIVAVRNLMRHKGYSAINIVGLAVGMACCVLMLLLVQDELSHDQFHLNKDRIYRITYQERNKKGEVTELGKGPYRLADALRTDFPGLQVVRVRAESVTIRYGEKRFVENRYFLVEPNVFDVFTFPLSKGNPKTALQDPWSVVITKEMAHKYFGNDDPMGKALSKNKLSIS